MSLKHAILGFLSYQALTGYDLKKAFDRSVQHFWPANQSQIYRTLATLDEEGLVEKAVIHRDERLDMKVYSLTEAGRAELHRWLSTPLPPRETREPFLIQVFFGGQLSDEEILNLLQREMQSAQERLVVYHAIYEQTMHQVKTAQDPRAFFLSMQTLDYGMASDQALVTWLDKIIQKVKTQSYFNTDFTEGNNT